ncbi:PAS domain-containing protein [Spirosoma sp. RP8]|uniref:histidine kinase n=1 Tax=Spirosoma liriopis TaxID=2937440 RepID=A0ABT0HUE4_9BACT|nr:PAS domain-containing sensor histidine kinase [Spirosoma liriopis]MCK8495595.1 PAS domain-containing protein [Spirosoma liriopis]
MPSLLIDPLAVLNALPGNHLILLPDAPTFTIVGVTDAYLAATYTQRETIIGKGVFEALPDSAQNQQAIGAVNLGASLREVLHHKRPQPMADQRYDIINPLTGQFEVKVWKPLNQPVLDSVGEVGYIIHTVDDITETVQLREAGRLAIQQLGESENRFHDRIEQVPLAIALTRGNDGVIESINASMLQIIGQTDGRDVLGKKLAEVLPHGEDQPLLGLIRQVLRSGEPFRDNEVPVTLWSGGKPVPSYVDISYTPVVESGVINAVLHVAVDVTQQVLARRKLEESGARLRSIVQQSPAATLVLGGNDFVIEQINQPMLAFIGRGEEVIGQPLLGVMPELGGQFAWQQAQRVYREGVSFDQSELLVPHHRTGIPEDYYYNVAYRPLREGEQIIGLIQVAVDVTEQVTARRKLEESEARFRQLSADLEQQVQARTAQLQASVLDLLRSNDNLQQFAYIASHDLQEPLRKIQSFGDLLKTQYAEPLGEGMGYLERMQSAAGRMSTLIKDLLAYSRISTQQNTTSSVSLNELVQSVLSDLDMRIGETSAEVVVESLPTVPGDASQLSQLFANLLSNALKFRRPGVSPLIRVSCRRIPAKELPPSVQPTRTAASYYQVKMADNGIGFDDKYVDRIFQVFQRLHGKGEYAGTGIGLAICQKVAANHGGAITASSQPGKGPPSTCTCRLRRPLLPDSCQ